MMNLRHIFNQGKLNLILQTRFSLILLFIIFNPKFFKKKIFEGDYRGGLGERGRIIFGKSRRNFKLN